MVQRKVSYKLSIQPKTTLKTDKNHTTTTPQNYDVKAIKMKKSRYMKRSTDIEFQGLVTPTKTPSPKKTSSYDYSAPNYMKSTNSSELHKVRSLTKSPSFKHSRTTGSRKKAVFCDNIDAQRATCSSTLKEYKFPSYLTLTVGATEAEGTSVMKVCPYTYCSLNGHRHNNSAPPLKSFLASRRKVIKTQKKVVPAVVSAPCKRKRAENKLAEDASEKGFSLNDDFFVEIHVPGYGPAEEIPVSVSRKEGSSEWDYNASDVEMDSDSTVSLDQLFGEVSDMEWEEGHIVAFDDDKVDVLVQKGCGGDDIEPGFKVEKIIDGELLPYIYDEMSMECFQFSDADTISDSESSQTDGDYIVEQIVDDETSCTAKIEELPLQGIDVTISKLMEESQNESLDSPEEHNEANGDELNKDMYLLENTSDGNISDIDMEEIKSSELVEDLPWEARNSENDDSEEESPLSGDNSHFEVDQSEAENTEDETPLNSDSCQAEVDQSEAENTEDESPLNNDISHAEVDQSDAENTEDESPLNSGNNQAEVFQSEAENPEDESPLNSNNGQAEVDQSEEENTEDESLGISSESPQPTHENSPSSVKDVDDTVIKVDSCSASSEEYDSNEVKLNSIDFILVEEVNESEIEDISTTEKEAALPIIINKVVQVCKSTSDKGNDCINELEDCCIKLKKSVRRNKTEEDSEDARDFNPRAPNFLPVEAEPEAEKVDLRHQDMDERRDAQDWMLDHALQKTVNQLGNARKRKVSLLVEAFEAVLPVPKYEPHIRRNISGFVHTRPVQACR